MPGYLLSGINSRKYCPPHLGRPHVDNLHIARTQQTGGTPMSFWGACGMHSEVKKAGPMGALGQVSLKTKITIEGGGTDLLALIERGALKQK